ncbi:Hsp20 family protein [Sphingomonas sp. ZT3P38]|uniref:Hsp20 family protein n=1 Tax=Parasphingomonas zepuensis TaxID=3096161 RepID=UPI002FC95A1E
MRTNFDFAPYRRSTVGFDRLFDLLETNRAESDGFPPFDIERQGDDAYRITLAVPGFRPGEIEIIAHQNLLTVSGRGSDAETGQFIHRGISTRAFERRFQLADFVEVKDARFDNGLLHIALKRDVPEQMKPRRIEIAADKEGAPANDRLAGPSAEIAA